MVVSTLQYILKCVVAELSCMLAQQSGAPWVRKCGCLCIQEILVLNKSSRHTSTPSCNPGVKFFHFKHPRILAVNHMATLTFRERNKGKTAESFFQLNFNVYDVVQFYPWFKFYFLLFMGMVMYDVMYGIMYAW